VSISPAFYEQLFCTKEFFDDFLHLNFLFVFFGQSTLMVEKAAREMMMKLSTGGINLGH